MAIHPFMPTSVRPEQTGYGGNLMDAFMHGVKQSYVPRNASEDLLAKMLTNKIQGVNAKYAEPNALADLLTKNLTNEYSGKSMPERLRALSLGNEGTSLGNQYNRESMPDRLLANQLTNQNTGFDIEKKRAMYDFIKKHPNAVVGGMFQQLAAIQDEEDRIRNDGYLQEPVGATQVGDEQEITEDERKKIAPHEYQANGNALNGNTPNEAQAQQLPFIYKLFESLKKQQEQQEERKNLTGKTDAPQEEKSKAPTIKERLQGKVENRNKSKLDSLEALKNKILKIKSPQVGAQLTAEQKQANAVAEAKHKYTENSEEYRHAKGNWDKMSGYKELSPSEIKSQDKKLQQAETRLRQTHEHNKVLEENRRKKLQQDSYFRRSADEKASMIAQAQGAGVTGDEASTWFSNGGSLDDLMINNGFSKGHWPTPIAQLTSANRTAMNQRNIGAKEVSHIGKYILDKLGKDSATLFGYSIADSINSLTGRNPDEQSDFLSARALAAEQTSLRLIMANAKSTVHAIKTLNEKSLTDIKSLRPHVTAEVWKETQRKINTELHEALEYAQKGAGSAATQEDIAEFKESTKNEELYKSYQAYAKKNNQKEGKLEDLKRYAKIKKIPLDLVINKLMGAK